MTTQDPGEDRHWFILNFIPAAGVAKPRVHIDTFNKGRERLMLFAPQIRAARKVNGKVVFMEKSLTFHYVFVKGTLSDVKELCGVPGNGFSFMLDHSSVNRYGIVSDAAMANFMLIARLYTNTIPFYDIRDIELEEGDVVEVVDGPYAGLSGVFMPKSRSRNGNIVIAATASLGAVLWDVSARYIRILKFSPNTRRPYEYLENYIERLLPVMRKFHRGEGLSDKEKALVSVFTRRMGETAVDNRKLEAKLAAALMCSYAILGDADALGRSSVRYEKSRKAMTNPWTRSLADLLLYVCDKDLSRLHAQYKAISDIPGKLSVTQKQILSEYRYYLGLPR